ncbi:hypothetical protein AB0I16_21260 [Streptomyces sp. NPDC050703]|uniref:hypothetical protein n=1 Tax=Streptomyces sp. NPDC050703 TaxID=3157218 RepID=UPI003432BF78
MRRIATAAAILCASSSFLVVPAHADPTPSALSSAYYCEAEDISRVDGKEVRLPQKTPLHSYGPYGDCPGPSVPAGTTVTYDCYTTNRYGNKWTHISDPYIGWIWNKYLPDGGSRVHC